MKQIKFTFLLTALFSMVGAKASAYNIAVANDEGVVICYNYINNSTELAVVKGTGSYSYQNDVIYRIPKTVMVNGKELPVTRIEKEAFYNSKAVILEIPEGIKSIGESAFKSCKSLKTFKIPDSVEGEIGKDCFNGCEMLTSVQIGENITSIGTNAFNGCKKLVKVVLPDKVSVVGTHSFNNCSSLASISFGSGISSFAGGGYASEFSWEGCSALKKIIIRDLSAWCRLNFKTSSDNPIYRAGNIYSDENTPIKDLVIPDDIACINKSAFYECKNIESVTIPNSVQSIEDYGFYNCANLKKLILGNSLQKIGIFAFSDTKLDTVICNREIPPTLINEYVFKNSYKGTLFVPKGSINVYKETHWKRFNNIREISTITLDKHEISLKVGETNQLSVSIYPSSDSDKPLVWKSTDENILNVDENGLVTALKPGKASIVATLKTYIDVVETCEVTVIQPVTGITLNETSLTMTQLGEMKQLVANVLPEDASNKEVKWTSSNAAVCSVSESGMVVATGYGEATVIATTVDGGFPAACVVNVTKPSPPITLTAKSYTRVYGEANPTFGYDVEGGELSGAPQITCEATKESPVGIYPIVITKGSVSNENVTYVNGTLTIEKAYQTLSWEQDLSKVKKYDQVELLATASSGLEVTYTIEGNPICSVVKIGNKQFLDCTGEGEAVIVAVQEGNNNYWQTTKIYKPIVIQGTTGIGSASLELDRDAKIFDLTGNCIEKMQKGVNIVRMSDGTVKKVIVK